jgi:hypothetical protein
MRTTLQQWLPQVKQLLGGYKYVYDDTTSTEEIMTKARAMLMCENASDSADSDSD